MNIEDIVGIGDRIFDEIARLLNIGVTLREGIEGKKWVSEFKIERDEIEKPLGYIKVDTNVKRIFVFKKLFTKKLLVFMHYRYDLFYVETNDKRYIEKNNPKKWNYID